MQKVLITVIVIFSMLVIFEAVALALPRQAVGSSEQPKKTGDERQLQSGVNKAIQFKRFAASLPVFDSVAGMTFNKLGSEATNLRNTFGQSVDAVSTAFGRSTGVKVNAADLGADARGPVIGDLTNAVGAALGGAVKIVPDGLNGGEITGDGFGSNAIKNGDAFGGSAIAGVKVVDFLRLSSISSEGNMVTSKATPSSSAIRLATRTPSAVVWLLLAAWKLFTCLLTSGP